VIGRFMVFSKNIIRFVKAVTGWNPHVIRPAAASPISLAPGF
jgi:hypothetical protein